MNTKTVTLNLQKQVEAQFRTAAAATFGTKKGYLGKAANQALGEWAQKRASRDANLRALKRLEKGFRLGGLTTKNRADWHER